MNKNKTLLVISTLSLLLCAPFVHSSKRSPKKDVSDITRQPQYPIDRIFTDRWSPRAMSGKPISHEDLMSLFEAARWAPSSYNDQPWRFVYAHRETPAWQPMFDLLVDFNKEWCKHAGALVLIVSHTKFEHNNAPSRTHSFDAGAAWQNLALQGTKLGLVVHGMAGFDYDRAKKVLQIPDEYTVEAMCAIGHPGPITNLSENLRPMEKKSGRKRVEQLVFEGTFK